MKESCVTPRAQEGVLLSSNHTSSIPLRKVRTVMLLKVVYKTCSKGILEASIENGDKPEEV